MELLSKPTRFRAYQLGTEGSSFSYYDGKIFTLIEARLTDTNLKSLVEELKKCGRNSIDTLHITSWDVDHCRPNELKIILSNLKPSTIEYPGYLPASDSGKESKQIINNYTIPNTNIYKKCVDPTYIRGLDEAGAFGYKHVLYNPRDIYEDNNNNSIVKLFRSGSFTVASLGDVFAKEIQETLMSCSYFTKEVDVMILAHHGADNGFTTSEFLKAVKPSVCVVSSDYDDKYGHPKPVVKDCVIANGGYFYTTKTGDVIIQSYGDHSKTYNVANYIADSTELKSAQNIYCKRYLASIGKYV